MRSSRVKRLFRFRLKNPENGGPGNASKILPVLAYQIGIQAGNLGRGAAIALFLVPLLAPAMFLFLRNLRRREY